MMIADLRLRENYANTLFELAGETQAADVVEKDLETIAGIIREEDDLLKFLTSPYFSMQHKEQFMAKVLSGRIEELTMNFLMVLIRHHRIGLLPEIILRYGQLLDAERHCYPVEVTVSRPLEPGEVERLTADMESAVGGTVRLHLVVNPDILGGTIFRYGDKIVDNSIRDRLRAAVKTIISQVKGRK